MPKRIDWQYHRKSCTTCKKAQGYLEANGCGPAAEVADATKQRKGEAEALALARAVARVVVAKGKKVVTFDLAKDKPDDATLLAHLMGPTGNLRAPTLKVGKTLLVGFNEEMYKDALGL